jgi:hypothetical protein
MVFSWFFHGFYTMIFPSSARAKIHETGPSGPSGTGLVHGAIRPGKTTLPVLAPSLALEVEK